MSNAPLWLVSLVLLFSMTGFITLVGYSLVSHRKRIRERS